MILISPSIKPLYCSGETACDSPNYQSYFQLSKSLINSIFFEKLFEFLIVAFIFALFNIQRESSLANKPSDTLKLLH